LPTNSFEKASYPVSKIVNYLVAPKAPANFVDLFQQKTDTWKFLFSNTMPLTEAKNAPFTIVYNTEFNPQGHCARLTRDFYKKAGVLLDYGVQPGAIDFEFEDFELTGSDLWFASVAKVVAKYLV